jgi:hypothetical protein
MRPGATSRPRRQVPLCDDGLDDLARPDAGDAQQRVRDPVARLARPLEPDPRAEALAARRRGQVEAVVPADLARSELDAGEERGEAAVDEAAAVLAGVARGADDGIVVVVDDLVVQGVTEGEGDARSGRGRRTGGGDELTVGENAEPGAWPG